MQILAGGGKGLGRGIFEVPQLVLHAAVELVRILLALQVELHANCSILWRKKVHALLATRDHYGNRLKGGGNFENAADRQLGQSSWLATV